MTLLVSALAAVICTIIWYKNLPANEMRFDILCFMYWGATIMWFVDAIFEYAELGAEYFTPAAEDMLNDLFLGLSVVVFGMIVWIAILMIKDPKGIVKAAILKKKA